MYRKLILELNRINLSCSKNISNDCVQNWLFVYVKYIVQTKLYCRKIKPRNRVFSHFVNP